MSATNNHQNNAGEGAEAVIGIDIGGTKTLMILRSLSGTVLFEQSFPSSHDCMALKSRIEEGIRAGGLNPGEIRGLAIGVPGRIIPEKQLVVDAPGLGWKNLSLTEELFRYLPFPCSVENDGTMALIAETDSGKATDVRNCLTIVIGTGLGSAFMADGHIIAGAHHSAGEIGYCIFEDTEEPIHNRSGHFGFLESKISGSALEKSVAGMTPQELFETYDIQTAAMRGIVDTFIYKLSIAIANLISILDPGTVIIGGGVSRSLEPFIGTIREQVGRLTPIEAVIEISKFFNRAGAIGACIRAERV
ncbi:MAG: ROK family protein [Saccharofermentanales bacterium]